MKKTVTFILTFLIVILSGCSLQEKMNYRIFLERLKENYPELTVANDAVYDESRKIFCFIDYNKTPYALQLEADGEENIKKICLASKDKTDNFKFVCEAIIKTYAENENSSEVINSLFADERNYYAGRWYSYAFYAVGETAYFSVENSKLSTNTDAELTLKQNDITYR